MLQIIPKWNVVVQKGPHMSPITFAVSEHLSSNVLRTLASFDFGSDVASITVTLIPSPSLQQIAQGASGNPTSQGVYPNV